MAGWVYAKYRGRCEDCKGPVNEGDKIYYNGCTYCEECGELQKDEDSRTANPG